MLKKVLFTIVLLLLYNCNGNEETIIEYYDTGEVFKKTEKQKVGHEVIYYYHKDGILKSIVTVYDDETSYKMFFKNGQISREGKIRDFKDIGWHDFYNEAGKKTASIFFINNENCQVKNYDENGNVNLQESLYTELFLPSDTLEQYKETEGYLRYHNGKSKYEYIDVYLNSDINSDFSNIYTVALDTFWSNEGNKDIYFKVKFENLGKNYIRGYLYDAVSDSLDIYKLNGIRVWFEKEVFVKKKDGPR